MKTIYLSAESYKTKEEIKPSEIILEKTTISGTRDILNAVADGHSIFPGLFDYVSGSKIEGARNKQFIISDSNKIPTYLKLKDHVVGSWFVFIDVDQCSIPAIDCIRSLTLKPTGAYYTYSGYPGKEKFRLIYEFSECLNREQYQGACIFLSELFTADTNEIVDPVSKSICQLFHGTSGKDKILGYNASNIYSWNDLGATEKEVQNTRIDVRNLIRTLWEHGERFLTLLDNVKTAHVSYISRTIFGKLLHPIFRTERSDWQPWGTSINGQPIIGYYQFIDKDSYLCIRFPKKKTSGKKVEKLRPGEGRKRYLRLCSLQIRAIKPNITPWDLLYSIMILRDSRTFWDYSGPDRIGVDELCHIVSQALSKSPEQIEQLTKAWQNECIKNNHSKPYPFIIAKWGEVNGKQQALSQDVIRKIKSELSSQLQRQATNDSIAEYYKTHPLTTPISIASKEIGISKTTLWERYKEYNVPDIPGRKAHKPHYSKQQELFKEKYDPKKSDRENKKALVNSGLMSRNTYYKLKQRYGSS